MYFLCTETLIEMLIKKYLLYYNCLEACNRFVVKASYLCVAVYTATLFHWLTTLNQHEEEKIYF